MSSYAHINELYWENGAVSQLSGISSTIGNVNYTPNARGIPYTATTSHITLVSTSSFNIAGLPTAVTFGSGDSDSFTPDPNTFRMTQYQFKVGNQTDTGTLTWNANGSLGQLAISDQLNSTYPTQTCTYVHDDLGRAYSATCGTLWTQNFRPDVFGNLYKSVPSGDSGQNFKATFSNTSNWVNNLGFAYDTNGNVTNDTIHSYSWDADGNSIAVDSLGFTYDAFDRAIEQTSGSAHTEVLYAPDGTKLALVNGSTLQNGFIALPGGGTAIYSSTGLLGYRHADWLGSNRLTSTPSNGVYHDGAYAPFGEPYAECSTCTLDLTFTGQNQGTAAPLYDFLFREYSNVQGRWVSPDPAGLAAADPKNPQSWNRYSYVQNMPLASVDPFGLYCDLQQAARGCGQGGMYTTLGDPITVVTAEGAFGPIDSFDWTSTSLDPITGEPIDVQVGAIVEWGFGPATSLYFGGGLGVTSVTSGGGGYVPMQQPKPEDCIAVAQAASKEAFAAAKSHMPDKWTVGGRVVVGGIIVGAIKGSKGGWVGAGVGAVEGGLAGALTAYGPSIFAYATGAFQYTQASYGCTISQRPAYILGQAL